MSVSIGFNCRESETRATEDFIIFTNCNIFIEMSVLRFNCVCRCPWTERFKPCTLRPHRILRATTPLATSTTISIVVDVASSNNWTSG